MHELILAGGVSVCVWGVWSGGGWLRAGVSTACRPATSTTLDLGALCAALALPAAGTSHTNVLRHCLPRSSYNPASAVPITESTSSVRSDKPTQATAGSTLTTSAKVLVSPFLGKVGKVPAKQTLKF